MFFKTFGSIVIALCLLVTCSFAQKPLPDTLQYSDNAKEVINHFNNKMGDQALVYNGDKYEPFSPHAVKGSVYFEDKSLCTPGAICFNGVGYKNIPVLFDAYNEDMVASLNGNLFILNPEKTSDIFLLGHHFIYVNATLNPKLQAGYYDIVYDGSTVVLVKRKKAAIENVVGSQTIEVMYADEADIYVKKNGDFFLMDGKNAFADLFKDKKKQLKQYQRENKINYSDDKEGWVTGLAKYYDSINK
jgi:hypothetical protein